MSATDRDSGVVKTDVSQIELEELDSGRFPSRAGSEYRVCITAEAFDAVKKHAASDTTVELCGVLAGSLLKDDSGPFLLVEHAIAGKATRRTGSQVTFTHETWEQIHGEMESSYPDKRIVGWYHTHPGFGIFLSEMDQFIQDNFFNLPHSVAFVYDPLTEERGLFIWKDGRSVRLRRYWLDDELCYDLEPKTNGHDLKAEKASAQAEVPGERERREPFREPPVDRDGWGLDGRGGMSITMLLAVILMVAAAFWAGSMLGRVKGGDSQGQNLALENLIRSGLFRDGLGRELDQVTRELNRAHSALSAMEGQGPEAAQGEAAQRIRDIQESVRQAHQDLNRITKTYTAGDLLARRMKAVASLADDVALLKGNDANMRTVMAASFIAQADIVAAGPGGLGPEERMLFAQHLRQLAIQLVPELGVELSRQAAEERRRRDDDEAGD